MKEKKLPLCNSPIRVYSNFAYVLSVLLNNEEAKGWFYSNFIQVKYIKDTIETQDFVFNYSLGNLTKYFYNIPYLEVRSLKRSFLLSVCSDIIDFLCSAIKAGYYIMTIVDNYYLPPKREYNKNHNKHLIMVNGFNIEEKVFYCMGYNDRLYEEAVLKFDDFYMAVSSEEGNKKRLRDDLCMMYKLQDKDEIKYIQEGFNYFTYKFNKKLVRQSLQEYLYSVCSDEHFAGFYEVPAKSEYGIIYYEAMGQFLLKYVEGIYSGEMNVTSFHGMLEHKILMIQRLKYMQDNQYASGVDRVVETYIDLKYSAEIIRNMILKYNMTKNVELLKRAKRILDEMYVAEKEAVRSLVNLLD